MEKKSQIRKIKNIKTTTKKNSVSIASPLKKVVTLLDKEEELVVSSPSQRNWRGIFIALLVIAAVLGLIVFSIFLLSPEDEAARVKGRRLSLSDINNGALKWKPFNGTWISEGELVFKDPDGGLSILSIETYSIRVLMTNSTFRQLNAEKFIVSPDLKYVLLLADNKDDSARYFVYDVQSRNIFPLTPKDGAREAPHLQHVLWAPNAVSSFKSTQFPNALPGNKNFAQAIAFVYENDLYYKPKVQNDLVCRITNSGKKGIIYNGIPDWLYLNTPELQSETLAFSTNGSYLSFLSFNDSQVNEYDYMWMGDNWKYPRIRSIRYPKEDSINPNVTVFVVDLSVLKFINIIEIKHPTTINSSYVGNMIWVSATELSVTFTNREQTSALTVLCRAPDFNCVEIHVEMIVDNGNVLPADKTIFSRNEAILKPPSNAPAATTATAQQSKINISYIFPRNESNGSDSNAIKYESKSGIFMLKRLPVRDGEHGYYRHVVFILTSEMRAVPLTMGQFEVTEILGWDEPNETIYFMAAPKMKPGQRHLYKINLTLNVTQNDRIAINSTEPVCMTCSNNPSTFKLFSNAAPGNISSENLDSFVEDIPNNCLYNKIYFSTDFSYYVQECLGPDVPSVYLVETSSFTKVFSLNSGDILRNRVDQLAVPQIRTFSVEIRHGFHAQVRLFLPPGMREEEEIAFPLIMHIDAAPGSQLVSEKFEVDWNWYLCSQKSMIVAQIDARGSGYQGELLRSQIKNKLGTVEIEDQLGVLTYLRDNLKFIDPTRICAYGWGYGGYAASMILAEDSQRVLQCALAINPIVSFAHHSAFFSERYMPKNDDYIRALQESDLSMRAGNIDSRNYFLIHGTADTIVHQQHSLMLARALIDEGVGFRHQVYTDEGHTLSGVLYHLYKTIEWFFDESFGPLENVDWDPTGFFSFKQ